MQSAQEEPPGRGKAEIQGIRAGQEVREDEEGMEGRWKNEGSDKEEERSRMWRERRKRDREER